MCIRDSYSKEKLLADLGQADDAMIRTIDGKSLIIYNPNNGNDDNASMWNDDTVFAVDQDGGEHEIRYDQIDDFQLEEDKNDVIDQADLALIGTNYLAGFGKEHTLSPEQLIDLGRKIVTQLYKGDIGAALAKHGQESTI